MNNVKATAIAVVTAVTCLTGVSLNAMAMDKNIETALIDICQAAKSNNLYRFHNTVQSYHLDNKTIALKVMCNGDDITSFAERYGADKTATRLERSIGKVNITDVAAMTKINVNFSE